MNMIAKTILEQIGGRRFAAMTGSKDFIDMGNGLRMSLARNKTSEYNMECVKTWLERNTPIAEKTEF